MTLRQLSERRTRVIRVEILPLIEIAYSAKRLTGLVLKIKIEPYVYCVALKYINKKHDYGPLII